MWEKAPESTYLWLLLRTNKIKKDGWIKNTNFVFTLALPINKSFKTHHRTQISPSIVKRKDFELDTFASCRSRDSRSDRNHNLKRRSGAGFMDWRTNVSPHQLKRIPLLAGTALCEILVDIGMSPFKCYISRRLQFKSSIIGVKRN